MTDHITAVSYKTAVKQLANTQRIMFPHRHHHRNRHRKKSKVCVSKCLVKIRYLALTASRGSSNCKDRIHVVAIIDSLLFGVAFNVS